MISVCLCLTHQIFIHRHMQIISGGGVSFQHIQEMTLSQDTAEGLGDSSAKFITAAKINCITINTIEIMISNFSSLIYNLTNIFNTRRITSSGIIYYVS